LILCLKVFSSKYVDFHFFLHFHLIDSFLINSFLSIFLFENKIMWKLTPYVRMKELKFLVCMKIFISNGNNEKKSAFFIWMGKKNKMNNRTDCNNSPLLYESTWMVFLPSFVGNVPRLLLFELLLSLFQLLISVLRDSFE